LTIISAQHIKNSHRFSAFSRQQKTRLFKALTDN
jgi:hypothetical protein